MDLSKAPFGVLALLVRSGKVQLTEIPAFSRSRVEDLIEKQLVKEATAAEAAKKAAEPKRKPKPKAKRKKKDAK